MPITIRININSADFSAAVDDLLAKTPAAAAAASQAIALSFIAEAKRNATGPARPGGWYKGTRPASRAGGPGVVTGFLRNSIAAQQSTSLGEFGWVTTVYPGGPYYRRLELGFTGTDSIGRRYNQPPYPFMRPALETTAATANAVATPAFMAVFGW
jgi:hypothetical protein